MENFIEIQKSEQDINQLSPLVWAYVGDSVFELFVRTYLINTTNLKPHRLHIEAIRYVKAGSQCYILRELEQFLSDDEKDIVRRGRNAKNHHLPKNSNVMEYMYSTAFEALIGFLYLNKDYKRVKELVELAIQIIKNKS